MENHVPSILQINTQDCTGGAARIAWNLFKGFEINGYKSRFAVGTKESHDPAVFLIPNYQNRNPVARFLISLGETVKKIPMLHSAGTGLIFAGQPAKFRNYILGYEDFEFPGTHTLPTLIPNFSPDIIHCHNLHGGYFDLRELSVISRKYPVIITLHDAWLISGHCAHSFACEKWKTGCGNCPDLTIYPAIRKDATAENWNRKQKIFSKSRFYVSTPSQWMMDKVNQSILAPAIIDKRVIPNGIDLTIFRPGNQTEARADLGLPANAWIVLFAADGIRANAWKDFRTMQNAIKIVLKNYPNSQLLFLALGENAPDEYHGSAIIRFIPYQKNPKIVARYYQAADIYIHAAHAETFSNTVAEAKACGTPVVATATGAIPEQLSHGVTGLVVPSGDAQEMATAIQRLLDDPNLRDKIAKAGVNDVRSRYSLDLQVNRYLSWYEEILDHPK